MNRSVRNTISRGTRITVCILFLCLSVGRSLSAQSYAIGADLSFMKSSEDNGFIFKENGDAKPCIEIFREHGYNWIRLRLFHTPTQLPNTLEYTIATALQAKKAGMKFLLDYHYSDTWADPQKQFIPEAWQGKTHDELVQAVFEYTRSTLIAFREAGAYPDMVQIGNEISHGMLWPDGKLPENWDHFAELVRAGIRGIHASCKDGPCPEIMIHIDKGGDREFTEYWFDKFHSYGIPYDVIGQSYYPWWHGSLLDLRECLNWMALTYRKDIYVVETAYNWTPREYIDKPAPFPESPEGQRAFLEEVNRIVLNVPDNLGRGVFWWEPAVSRRGSRSFFDEEGNVLPVIHVFDRYTRK